MRVRFGRGLDNMRNMSIIPTANTAASADVVSYEKIFDMEVV